MNCPGPNSDAVDPVVAAHPADGVEPVVVAHPADGVDPVVVARPADGADPADDPELPERVVVAVPADDLVSQARRDNSDVKLEIPRT